MQLSLIFDPFKVEFACCLLSSVNNPLVEKMLPLLMKELTILLERSLIYLSNLCFHKITGLYLNMTKTHFYNFNTRISSPTSGDKKDKNGVRGPVSDSQRADWGGRPGGCWLAL